jgi:hypothetical protein
MASVQKIEAALMVDRRLADQLECIQKRLATVGARPRASLEQP